MKKVLLLGAIIIANWSVAMPAHSEWKGQASLGLVAASGNSDNSSISGNLGLSKKAGIWKHNMSAEVYKAKTDGVSSADRLMLGYKGDRDFTERLYGWGSLRMETDEFSDIDRRLVTMVGIGHHTLLGPVHTLDLEAGVGYSSTAFVSATADNNEAVMGLSAAYIGKLTDTVTLSERLSFEIGGDNTLTQSTTGLSYKLSDTMSLTASYLYRQNSDILGARGKKSDSLFTINLGVTF